MMASQNLPSYGVTVTAQDLGILGYVFAPEKPLRLVGRNFCLAMYFI